jgi:DNA primase
VARYTQDSIERLREAIDLVELVSQRTDLRQRGSRWVGLCPFHEERTPSFTVDPREKLYYCFGCHKGGDPITFVRESQALDFAEAVEQLADRYRVELKREHEDPQEEERRKRRERLLGLLDRAAGFYGTYLWDSSEARKARDYLSGRGLSEEVLRAFRVGYAPSAWDRLLTGARRDGFTEQELYAAGLAQRSKGGKVFDRFRERITFPLADARGRVLGFGARAMRSEQGAKYLNTAEGEVYHKGRHLFGIDQARPAISRERRAVVVEGYTDVLALHQAGVQEAVAIMGTAFTGDQLAELARAVGQEGRIFLALDADSSGQDAMLRVARMAEERQLELRVVELPDGSDPADLAAAEGSEGVGARLQGALSVLEFAVGRVLADADRDSPEGRDRALAQARALIAQAPERSARRDHLVGLVADGLDVPADYVTSGAIAAPPRQARPAPRGEDPGPEREQAPAAARTAAPAGPGAASLESERVFLGLCLASGSVGREYLGRLKEGHFSSSLTRRAGQYLAEHFDDPLEGLPTDDSELRELVAGVFLHADDDQVVSESSLQLSFLALDMRRIEREVRQARREGDFPRVSELAGDRQRVRNEMDAVMGQAT